MGHVKAVPFQALGGLFENDDVAAATSVIESAATGGTFFPMPEESRFQEAFAAFEGASHAVAVNSCGTALDLCMMALGIGPGDEVIVPPLTFVCTATCASARGAKVVFADIDRRTLCLDPDAVRQKISPRTKAVLPVHFAGRACDLDSFDALSRETGVAVIYDAAHSAGARHEGRGIGGRGVASCYSFQSNKNMTTLGEGGAVTTTTQTSPNSSARKRLLDLFTARPQLSQRLGLITGLPSHSLRAGCRNLRNCRV